MILPSASDLSAAHRPPAAAPRSGPPFRSRQRSSRRPLGAAVLAAALSLLLTGCVRTRSVTRIVVAQGVLNATLDQLLTQLARQDAAIQTLNATVDISASTGGEHEGKVKETPSFAGYIFLRRPADIRVLMLVPVLRSRALDMVSDGSQFKLLIPSKNKAIVGTDAPSPSDSSGIYSIRPYMIRDALLIPTAGPDEYVALTKESRILPPAPGRKYAIEEPDYDITISRIQSDHILRRIRVIHFGRISLKPYEQDIYNDDGRIVTTVTYDKYQKFGEIDYPTSIVVSRPIDELKLNIVMTKLVFNHKMDDEQFLLKFPEGVAIQKM